MISEKRKLLGSDINMYQVNQNYKRPSFEFSPKTIKDTKNIDLQPVVSAQPKTLVEYIKDFHKTVEKSKKTEEK